MTIRSVPLKRSVFSKAAQGCDIKYNMFCTSFHSFRTQTFHDLYVWKGDSQSLETYFSL